MEASHLTELLDATRALNAKYHSEIVTEFALNGLGILEQVRDKTRQTPQAETLKREVQTTEDDSGLSTSVK